MTSASAFCPAGISSFFRAETPTKPPYTMQNALKVGAKGGGFVIAKGIHTELELSSAKTSTIEVHINGRLAPEAKVTHEVCNLLLTKIEGCYHITVKHDVEVPIGAGYGASAAGAVSTVMALSKAAGLNMTLNQMAQYAHLAELRCATGLGSVSGVARGGAILILEAGAPGYDRVDWLPLEPSHRIVSASFAPIPKEDIIFSPTTLEAVNREAQIVMTQILSNPTPVFFMELCNQFARKAGFLSQRLTKVLTKVLDAGALGATQNMIGDAFHSLVYEENVDSVVESIAQDFPPDSLLVTEINSGGPRYK
jgi:pantoate kinase